MSALVDGLEIKPDACQRHKHKGGRRPCWAAGTASTLRGNPVTIRHLQKRGVGAREEVSAACEQLWPICTPVFINVDPATLMQRERAESESEVGQAANT